MTDEDFDKIDTDEDFTDEFDFVDADHETAAPSGGGQPPAAPSNQPAGTSIIVKIVVAIVVLAGGYYAYKHFISPNMTLHKQKDQAANAKAPLPAPIAAMPTAESTAMTTNTATAPATEETQQTAAQQAAAQQAAAQHEEASVDFNTALSNAAAGNTATTTTTTTSVTGQKDHLSEALPQGKSFDQVQRELKNGGNTNVKPKVAIPDEINATLDSISEEMTLNVNQIKQLETTITNLASSVQQLNKSISAMDNRVLSLTETVDGLAQDLNNVKKVMTDEDLDLTNPSSLKFTSKNVIPTMTANGTDYTVHAIIPGRAWLKGSNGQILTVTEGDKIGDYGTVAVIDAGNGLVRTSSGIIFR